MTTALPSTKTSQTWHDKTPEEIVTQRVTDLRLGLSQAEARARLAKVGANALRQEAAISPLTIWFGQFRSLVIWVLIGAAVVSALLGETVDGIAIIAIVLLNAIVGFFQEYRAERAAAALARLTAPRAKVVREGQTCVIAAADVVPGDVLTVEAGDVVAADARLFDVAALHTNEAPLTGESQAVEKQITVCAADTVLADRCNMVFFGTSIVRGSGRSVVVATGMQTEVGHIAALLQHAIRDETPLQKRLNLMATRLLWASVGIVTLVFLLGFARGIAPFELFLSAVSLAVAAIPEGLPTVVTISLALGMQRMARRNALVRRLPAVETLGCAQVICSDKTGTLTVGEMTARKVVTAERIFTISGDGYTTEGAFFVDGIECAPEADGVLADLLYAAVVCNDAELSQANDRTVVLGDPTEGALLVLAAKAGVTRVSLEADKTRLRTIPFDSRRKRMSVITRRNGEPRTFVKGAPEVILARCTQLQTCAGVVPLTASDQARMLEANALMANDALRVLALAVRPLPTLSSAPGDQITLSDDEVERRLTFLGLVGLQDPPRAEAREAVQRCQRAGIRTVMITGDHPDTARAIARELGMLGRGDEIVAGAELERLSDDELRGRVARIAVYARVTAEHKLRIVRALKTRGMVVAMTGDGVNDAPALREASIGIAMGITGTEVTKEAADLIIADDNFASIVAAVEEGRGIYDNIAKTLAYLLAGNAGELAVMLIAALIGWPLPLLPIQLLWINLVTDGLPALALATDPIAPGVLARPPRRHDAQLLDRALLVRITWTGMLTACVALTAFAYEFYVNDNLAQARNAAFSTLVIDELLRAFSARSHEHTVWQIGLLSNLRLFVIVAASLLFQFFAHDLPGLAVIFGSEPVTLAQGLRWLGLGAVPLIVLECGKVRRKVSGLRYVS